MRFLILTFFTLGLLSNGIAAQTKRPKKNLPAKQSVEKIVYESDAELLREIQNKVEIVESKKDWAKLDRQSPFANSSKTRTAYIAQFAIAEDAENLKDVIVVQTAGDKKFYEIHGFDDFSARPFSNIKWISDDVLQFEQWVNPTNGGRYRVNLKTGKAVAASYVRSN